MRNEASWKPTKFRFSGGKWCAGPNVGPGSVFTVNRAAPFYARAIQQFAGGRLLDLGCGMAPFYGNYRPLVDDIVCVDWGDSPYVDIKFDLGKPYPLDHETFDTILSSSVLEHIYHPHLLMSECARLVRPGGHLILSSPFL